MSPSPCELVTIFAPFIATGRGAAWNKEKYWLKEEALNNLFMDIHFRDWNTFQFYFCSLLTGLPLGSGHSKIPDFWVLLPIFIITSCSNNHRSPQVDTTVVYTTRMLVSSMVHGGSYRHLEVIISVKHPNCRLKVSITISEISIFGFMDIFISRSQRDIK